MGSKIQNIFQIISSGDLKKLSDVLADPSNLTQLDDEGNNLIHFTLKTTKISFQLSFISLILRALSTNGLLEMMNDYNYAGEIPLTLVCKLNIKKNVLAITKLFFNYQIDDKPIVKVNACEKTPDKWTPLHYAVMHPNPITSTSLVEMLLTNGAGAIPDASGFTAIHTAVQQNKSISVIRTLLQYRFPAFMKDRSGNTVFALACRYSNLNVVKLLASDNSEVLDAPNNDGTTPLHIVCARGHYDIFEWLVERCTNLNPTDIDGNTPLHILCINNVKQIGILERFICYIPDLIVNVGNNVGKTPLHYAAQKSHVDAVQLLLSVGADPSIRDNQSNSPKSYAINNPNVLTLLTYAPITN